MTESNSDYTQVGNDIAAAYEDGWNDALSKLKTDIINRECGKRQGIEWHTGYAKCQLDILDLLENIRIRR